MKTQQLVLYWILITDVEFDVHYLLFTVSFSRYEIVFTDAELRYSCSECNQY